MAISFNTGTSASASAVPQATSFTFTVPSGVNVGDFMAVSLECFTFTSASPGIATPTSGGGSWTQIGTIANSGPSSGLNSYGTAWYRVATASDPGSTFTVSFSGTAGATNEFWWAAALGSYPGTNTSSPIDTSGQIGALGNSVTLPSKNTGVNNAWALYLGGFTTGGGGVTGPSTPGSPVSRENFISGASVGAALFDSNGSAGSAGSGIGGGTFAATGTWWSAFTVSLAPAAAGVSGSFGLAMAPMALAFTGKETISGSFGLAMAPMAMQLTGSVKQNVTGTFGLAMAPMAMRFNARRPPAARAAGSDEARGFKRWLLWGL